MSKPRGGKKKRYIKTHNIQKCSLHCAQANLPLEILNSNKLSLGFCERRDVHFGVWFHLAGGITLFRVLVGFVLISEHSESLQSLKSPAAVVDG